MSAIRPGLPQPLPSQGVDAPTTRNAQAAFFRAALNQTQAPQPAAPPAPAAAVMSTVRTVDMTAAAGAGGAAGWGACV